MVAGLAKDCKRETESIHPYWMSMLPGVVGPPAQIGNGMLERVDRPRVGWSVDDKREKRTKQSSVEGGRGM